MTLEAKNIYKSFRNGVKKLSVLTGLNISVEKQETITIMGPSGSGKSTLLHILGTLDKPDSGSVLINQTDVSSMKEEKLALKNLKRAIEIDIELKDDAKSDEDFENIKGSKEFKKLVE